MQKLNLIKEFIQGLTKHICVYHLLEVVFS
jgi:hypothetical protein